MYSFLFNISFMNLCYAFLFSPKMLIYFVSEENCISYEGCMTQLYLFIFFLISECYIVTLMAYDHYVVICNLLLYKVTMFPQMFCDIFCCL